MDSARLALDVFEEITQHLALERDLPTLSSLALTTSALLEPCRKWIFYGVYLCDESSRQPSTYRAFDKLLTQSPGIGNHVREVHLSFTKFKETDSASLHSILDHLTKIEVLFVTPSNAETQRGVTARWEILHRGFRESVERILICPTLNYVAFYNIRLVPLSLIACIKSTQLRELHLVNSSLKRTSLPTCMSVRPSIALLSITNAIGSSSFGPADNVTTTLACIVKGFPVDVTRLTDLGVDINYNTAPQVQNLLNLCKETLECLAININGAGVVSLKGLRNLQSVAVEVDLNSFVCPPGNNGRTHSTFFDIVKTLDAGCPLRDGIMMDASRLSPNVFQMIPTSIWTRMDDLFVSLERNISIHSGVEVNKWTGGLPKTEKMGILAVVEV